MDDWFSRPGDGVVCRDAGSRINRSDERFSHINETAEDAGSSALSVDGDGDGQSGWLSISMASISGLVALIKGHVLRQRQSIRKTAPILFKSTRMEKGCEIVGSFWAAFLVGGLICVLGQLLIDLTNLTPAHVLALLVVAGAVLDGFGLYEPLIQFAGAGATVPITSFGNALVHGALTEAKENGIIGVFTGIFEITSAGISAALIFGFLTAAIFKPKG